MRRIGCMLAVSAVAGVCALAAVAQQESLGDYARAARKEKRLPAKMIYTNDNLPTTTTISVVGPAPLTTEETPAGEEKPAAKPQDEKEKPAQKESKTSENKVPQTEQEWQDQLSGQKRKIAELEHERELLQREYKLQVAQYYADAGTQLRDQKDWADQEVKFRAEIADKQKQIDAAKAGLQDMDEQQRQQEAQKEPIK